MEVIDFHTHLLKTEMLNPTSLNFLEAVNPEFFQKREDFGKDPGLFAAYLRTQGVKSAVMLPEYAPATSSFVSTEAVIEYCRGQDMLIPFASLNPNTHPEMAAKLEYFTELDKNGEKVIFGSDWPAVPTNIGENIEAIKSLPLSDSTRQAILYGNAHRILFR